MFTWCAPWDLMTARFSTDCPITWEFWAKVSPAWATSEILPTAASMTSPPLLPASPCATECSPCAMEAMSPDSAFHVAAAAVDSAIFVVENSAASCSSDIAGVTTGGVKLKFSKRGDGRVGKDTASLPTAPPSSARSMPRETKASCPVNAA